jgi:hypothetical protein
MLTKELMELEAGVRSMTRAQMKKRWYKLFNKGCDKRGFLEEHEFRMIDNFIFPSDFIN